MASHRPTRLLRAAFWSPLVTIVVFWAEMVLIVLVSDAQLWWFLRSIDRLTPRHPPSFRGRYSSIRNRVVMRPRWWRRRQVVGLGRAHARPLQPPIARQRPAAWNGGDVGRADSRDAA